MPFYDYECQVGHRFEVIRKLSERDQPIKCREENCDKAAVRKITAPAFVHGGFYDSLPKK